MMFYLKKIQLTNFKCYEKKEFEFHPYKNIIVGLNAVGKTSLVEAIYCLCFTKTFKGIKDIDLIKKGNSFFNIKALFNTSNGIESVFLGYDSINKRIKRDEKVYKSTSDYLGEYNAIVFSPDDLDFVKGSPLGRRKFLDTHISQINKTYLNSFSRYKKILKERNEFLKSIEDGNYDHKLLSIITEALIMEATIIIETRNTFINQINTYIEPISLKLSENNEIVKLVYKPHTNVDNLWKTSKERLSYDIMNHTTTWGPSRDDIQVEINLEDASVFASQGQIRSACLSVKLALTEVFSKINEKVLIILDDVLSEFDTNRQNQLFSLLDSKKQTFITTTSIDNLSKDILDASNIIEIQRGKIK